MCHASCSSVRDPSCVSYSRCRLARSVFAQSSCGGASPVGYFYCTYFAILLIHRAARDDSSDDARDDGHDDDHDDDDDARRREVERAALG